MGSDSMFVLFFNAQTEHFINPDFQMPETLSLLILCYNAILAG